MADFFHELNTDLISTNAALQDKAPSDHNHDYRYYTEQEIANLLSNKSNRIPAGTYSVCIPIGIDASTAISSTIFFSGADERNIAITEITFPISSNTKYVSPNVNIAKSKLGFYFYSFDGNLVYWLNNNKMVYGNTFVVKFSVT